MSVLYIRDADGTFQPVPSLQGESVSPLTVYPVGSVYISVSATSPASLFGGTWEQIKNTFLLAAGDSYAAGATGGEATHTLIATELPVSAYQATIRNFNGVQFFNADSTGSAYVSDKEFMIAAKRNINDVSGANNVLTTDNLLVGNPIAISNPSGGCSHNNMPPYLTVYMWRRVS